ncbi:nonribosomal peptide synthetase 6 [Diaporthe helianthi]|uniref:Nonribosomal peptide synthetase 6 n=1 Tax=Diaporthe helianthi TaxID=158607 RepID=A0A2P5I7B4_DIAHE|nr:nonribosomal peptide synthetase 6 [Diaporthe helianthi]
MGYVPNSVPAYSAESFLDTFVKIVTQFVCQSHSTPLLDLDVLGPYNRTIIDRWTSSELVRAERCIHHYVDEHARNTPEKEAVISTEGPNFTYAQLSRLSDKLATHLVSQGIKRGDFVPILFDKSSVAVIAVISIMKAGGAYVGFSPESPINFLRECAAVADAPLVITSRQHESLVERIGRLSLVIDSEFLDSLDSCPEQGCFESPATPSDLAYLGFTSGSTGVPKAVMTEHAAYVTDALAQQEATLLKPSTRLLHFASYNFDATNFDILSTLIAGATICEPSEYNRINHLAAEINTLGANYLPLTATVAQVLDPREVPGLEVVILCGEANSPQVVEKWVSSGLDVINGYGPSEASCAFSCNIYTRQNPQANNIGRALKGACQGHVVNPHNHNQLLPVGALGELLIRGPTLGRGYLNEPEKTAAVYIDSPSWLQGSSQPVFKRVYKTGDLVRQLPDQSFEIHGRIDKQVKLNGQRIELGEIEHQVGRILPEYQSVAVEVLQLSWQGGPRTFICAFYARAIGGLAVSKDANLIDMESAPLDISRIKALLAEDLKAVAIPQAFIPLKSMPVTTQGKLDRRTLQGLSVQLDQVTWAKFSGTKLAEDKVTDNFERRLQSLYAQVLNINIQDIFRDSDFTQLGGDSVKAIKFVSLARKAGLNASVPVSPKDVLRNPKLRELSSVLQAQKQDFEKSTYIPFHSIQDSQDFDDLLAEAARYTKMDDIEDIFPATDLQASCRKYKVSVRPGSHGSAQAVEYWRHLLSGAKPTNIAAQSGMPTFQDFVDGVLMRKFATRLLDLDRPSLPDSNATSNKAVHTPSTRATVVKTAWALALAELTGQDDILFGATAWGRNAPVPFAHDVVGCCSSHVPVRARVGEFDTYAGLLGDLQAQHVESMGFEMVGANTIVRECTDWPRWARLSSLVVFQGLDIDGEGQKGGDGVSAEAEAEAGPAEASGAVKFTEIMDPGDRADVIVHVEPFGPESRILMAFSKRRVPETTAQAMLDAFERYLGLISQCPAGSIQLKGHGSTISPTEVPHVGNISEEKLATASENATVAKEVVRSAWMNSLGIDDVEFENCVAAQTAFLDIWGNPVSAAGIGRHFKESGIMVTTEEVLGCPSVEDQIGLVSRKIMASRQ